MTSPHTDIEDVLCSKTRLKIMKVLMQSEQLTVSEITRRTTLNYVSTRAYIETLQNEKILTHNIFGKRIRYYRFKDSPMAKTVKDFMEAYSDW